MKTKIIENPKTRVADLKESYIIAKSRKTLGHNLTCSLWILFIILTGFTTSHASVYYLGIGNDGYHVDAEGLWNSLSVQSGWENASNSLLANRTGSQILNDISWLQQAGPGDLAIFCYSGHGGAFYEDNSDEMSGFAMDSYDEAIGYSGSYVRDDAITDALSLIDSQVPVITIFDACYAGGFIGGTGDLNRLGNVTALLSSREDQESYGYLPYYSIFTDALINGLSAGLPADRNGDGVLRISEWFSYATNHVSLPSGYYQNPVYWESSGFGDVAIVNPEPATVLLLTIGGLIVRIENRKK